MSKSFLLVDDEANIRNFIKLIFTEKGYKVYVAKDGEEAFKIIRNHHLDLLITDKVLPDIDGLDLIKKVQSENRNLPILMITAHGDVDIAVTAMKNGSYDFLSKPFSVDELWVKIAPVFERIDIKNERDALQAEKRSQLFSNIIGESEEIRKVFKLIEQVGKTKSTVLIQGETGTGKELVAQAVHKHSDRSEHAFIAINCTTLSENMMESELFGYEKGAFTDAKQVKKGLFETANKGSIFFDEIGDMSLKLQAKLLRVLQEKKIRRISGNIDIDVDVRIITATHRNLDEMVIKGEFREDLFFRLNVFPIELPALRDRKNDILPIADSFLDSFAKEFAKKTPVFSSATKKTLQNYDWAGNIRELRNVIERMMILTNKAVIEITDLPEQFLSQSKNIAIEKRFSFKKSKAKLIENFEQKYIHELLEETSGNVSQAAKYADMDRTVFQRLIRKYEVDTNLYRKSSVTPR